MGRSSVVTTKQVTAMREERAIAGWSLREIADRHGVSHNTVSRITIGATYPDLPGPITPPGTVAPQRTCWRGHELTATNVTYGTWTGCIKCKRIRNRQYMRTRRATAQ